VIERHDPRFAIIDAAAFKSKNLYNAALYEMRQAFILQGRRFSYNQMDKLMQRHEAYKELPAKVAQQVLKQLDDAWTSYFEACESYREDPSKFTGRPRLPKYKHKTSGRNLLVYTLQALSGGRGNGALQRGIIKPSGLPISVKTKQNPSAIDQARIVPKKGYYIVEVVYERTEKQAPLNPNWYAGIDLGIDNLAAVAANKPGFQSVVVNGRSLKSINQFYNKRKAELQKALGKTGTAKRMERLTNTRNRRIDHYMHTSSKRIIDLLVKEGIGTLVIGKNDGWKQEVEMGKRTNQNFCQIPHARFIAMLTYKAELVGITVKLTEESYTSKASLLDLDPLPKWKKDKSDEKPVFSGKRIKRGLYRTATRRLVNADINGAGNIMRKVAPNAFGLEGVEDGCADEVLWSEPKGSITAIWIKQRLTFHRKAGGNSSMTRKGRMREASVSCRSARPSMVKAELPEPKPCGPAYRPTSSRMLLDLQAGSISMPSEERKRSCLTTQSDWGTRRNGHLKAEIPGHEKTSGSPTSREAHGDRGLVVLKCSG
jgi:IS605 OrfB family transposase